MSAGMGLLYSLFASLLLAWPSERARRLTDFSFGSLSAATAALSGWLLAGLVIAAPSMAGSYVALTLFPEWLEIWRWIGLGVLFWLMTTGKLAPSLAHRPLAANDNTPVRGNVRILAKLMVTSYSWRMALMMAAVMPQFLDIDEPAKPQIIFTALVYTGLMLLSSAFYGLFPKRAHALLNVIPERRKAFKSGLQGHHQHGQTRISYRRIAA